MTDFATLAIILGTFFVAGGVKGVVGLGLPTVVLGILTMVLDLPTAMGLLLAPAIATNIFQTFVGGYLKVIVCRLWPFLLLSFATIWFGVMALVAIDPLFLSVLLGLLLLAYSICNLLGWKFRVAREQEKWVGVGLGAINGIFTGMTGASVVPGVMFLQALQLPRDMLVQAMGTLFLVSSIGLSFALQKNNILNPDLVLCSVVAILPAIGGMWAGQKLRRNLSEQKFRKILFLAILILGFFIIVKSCLALFL